MPIARVAFPWLSCATLSRSFVLRAGICLAVASSSTQALAEPKDDAARALQREAMDGDYLGTQFKAAEKNLQKALKTCGKKGCSKMVLAELHRDLAVVYIAGLKTKNKGKKAMQAALQADPAVQLNPDFTTPEVQKVYEAAGGAMSEPEPEAEPEPEVTLEEEEPSAPDEAPDEGGTRNWFSLSFQQDLLSYSATDNVCSSALRRGAEQYQCFLQGSSYEGEIFEGSGNQLQGGVGLATKRLLLGYDRLFGENITLGARLGFAFGGSPKATTANAAAFLPLHAELRGSYWFGDKPMAEGGLRGYAGAAAALGEVDGHVTVEYFEHQSGYDQNNKGKLDAWRKTGNTILALHAGLAYGIGTEHALHLELRVLQMLGASALGGALNVGYAFGL
jgi:hypothetical protein